LLNLDLNNAIIRSLGFKRSFEAGVRYSTKVNAEEKAI